MTRLDIISGFLGAGKTTFANIALRYHMQKGEKAAYIVNEFGNTGLDAEIIRGEGFNAVELSNGCVCCTLKGETIRAVKEIISAFAPSRIVFEPSGVFVFNNFFDMLKDEQLKSICKIGSVITIVDSLSYAKTPAVAGSFIENQIKNSNMLVVSKLERFSGDVNDILCDLKNKNPAADIVAKPWNRLTATDLRNVFSVKPRKSLFLTPKQSAHPHLQAITMAVGTHFNEQTLGRFTQTLLQGKGGAVLRAKGHIRLNEKMCLFNMACGDVTVKPAFAEECSLTFIGERIEREKIEKLLS